MIGRILKQVFAAVMVASLAPTIYFGTGNWTGFHDSDNGPSIAKLVDWSRAYAQGTNAEGFTIIGKLFAANKSTPPTATNATVGAGATNFMGSVTATSAGSNVVITFSTAYSAAPVCFVTNPGADSTKIAKWSVSTTAITVTANTFGAGQTISYLCIGTNR